MQIKGDVVQRIAKLGKTAERKLEKAGIVGLLLDLAARLEKAVVDTQVVFIGQTALVAFLGRPGIGKVEIDP